MLPRRLRPAGERIPVLDTAALLGFSRRRESVKVAHFSGWNTHWYGSGTAALAAALAVAIRYKGVRHPEVILPAYACPDLVSATIFAGAHAVLADSLPSSPWLDPLSVTKAISANTVAVVYVRFLGMPANDLALRSVVEGKGPLLIEDCAHGFPQHERVESSADLLVFSFGRGKPLSLRCGGVLLQNTSSGRSNIGPPPAARTTESLLSRAGHRLKCSMYNVAIQPNIYWLLTQLTCERVDAIKYRALKRLTGFPESLGDLLPTLLQRHRASGTDTQDRVASLLAQISGPWNDVASSVTAATKMPGVSSVSATPRLWRYPMLLRSERERNGLFGQLWAHGLGASRMYRNTLARIPGAFKLVRWTQLENADDFGARLLALPLHSDVSPADHLLLKEQLDRFSARLGAISLASSA